LIKLLRYPEYVHPHICSCLAVLIRSQICGLDAEELDETHRENFLRAEPVVEPPLSKVPEVDSSDVKGSSLWAIRASLKSLTDPRTGPSRQQFGQNEYAFQIERQKQLEMNAIESAQERWRKDHEELQAKGIAPLTNSINSLLWSWHQSLVPLIEQELDRVVEAEDTPDRHSAADRCLYGPFLRLMSPDKIAAIVVLEIIRLRNVTVDGEGTKSSHAVMSIGKTLEQEYYAQELSKRKNRDIFGVMANEELEEIFSNRAMFRAKVRSARNKSLEKPQETADLMFEWPGSVRAKLGAVLISMLLHCAKVPITKALPNGEKVTQHLSAMNHAYEYVMGRRLGVIKLHPEVIKKLGHEPLRGSTLGRNLPMLVPPRPWVAWNDGGYFYTRSRVVRTKQSREQDIYVQTASDRGDLDDLFQGLDVLGQTSWKINKKVFDVILKVWNDGDALAEIPPRELDIEIPPEPETKDPKIRHKWVVDVRNLKNKVKNNHSTRCTINLKVEIARAFLFEKFYFPHNMDFRGRAYPIPPNLNHIGDDLSRGLLMFAEGKELGENGLKWLKIHCANLAGYDKASFADRVRFIDENLDNVFDSAEKPLEVCVMTS
jgi:DNA-directed RNA polymerase